MHQLDQLREIRDFSGQALTTGLADEVLEDFLQQDEELREAIESAGRIYRQYRSEFADKLQMDEEPLIRYLQQDYVNFYADDAVNPYISLSAKGPWLITMHGAVLYDCGGYGMLGFGHAPDSILKAMNQSHVMANIMTANINQLRLTERLSRETAYRRKESPYDRFICVNSGSESVTVATRISDLHAKQLTCLGARHAGKSIKMLSLVGSFHGRTDRPAQASDSTMTYYQRLAASFQGRDNLYTVEPNNIEQLHNVFEQAERDNVFIEMMLMEPVMGEGSPGIAITPEFYEAARKLTSQYDSLLMIDSIQAGLRASGCLSIMGYPGFEHLPAPDMETYSKALNAGQYPLSVLAMTEQAAGLYQRGVYGNTMTTNPRALDVACAVLDQMTDSLRQNIVERGKELLDKFQQLADEFPDAVTGVTGTGLLCAVHLKPDGYQVVGENGVERYLRTIGVGVIHGGANALRFTPRFAITSKEIDLVIARIRESLARGPVYS